MPMDANFWFEQAFHYAVVPITVVVVRWIGKNAEERLITRASKQVVEKLPEIIEPVLDKLIEQRLRGTLDDALDAQLRKINGTYVRSREQEIRDHSVTDRIARLERRVDEL